jgi:ABC-type multidrug transport system ATPase subunit
VRLEKVRKLYGPSLAVDKVSFGLEYGECFALLGVSGAGKTTTFKCLTGEEKPTEGQVSVNGFDVTTREGFDQARRLIGYCP